MFCGAGPSRGAATPSTTTTLPWLNRRDALQAASSTRTWPASIERRRAERLNVGSCSARNTSSRRPACSGATVRRCGQDGRSLDREGHDYLADFSFAGTLAGFSAAFSAGLVSVFSAPAGGDGGDEPCGSLDFAPSAGFWSSLYRSGASPF